MVMIKNKNEPSISNDSSNLNSASEHFHIIFFYTFASKNKFIYFFLIYIADFALIFFTFLPERQS